MEPLQNIQLTFKCPKTLNDLTPCNSGWYCAGCNRLIMDFRGVGEEQILNSLNSSDKIHCGIFDAGRINYTPQPKWRRWLSAGAIALGLATLNNMVFAQQKGGTRKKLITNHSSKAVVDTTPSYLVGVVMPSVPARYEGGLPLFYEYLKKNLSNVSVSKPGKTLIKFIIEKDGFVTNVNLINEGDANIDRQLIGLIKSSKKWYPAMDNGLFARTEFNCHVTVNAPDNVEIKVEQTSQDNAK